MKYERIDYKTSDEMLNIEFLFLNLGEALGWRGYVLNKIDYKRVSNNRSDNYTDTHLYIDDGTNRFIDANKDYPYICWTEPVFSLDIMHEIARMWSEITAYYIKHGGSFENIEKILREEGIL